MYSPIVISTITLSLLCQVLGNEVPNSALRKEQVLQDEIAVVEYLEQPLDEEDQKGLLDLVVKRDHVTFFLYTKNDGNKKFVTDDVKQFPTEYKNYIFIVHGWTSSRKSNWYSGMTEAILKGQDNAVIQVDWSIPASIAYLMCKNFAIKKVGGFLGDFIIKLHQELKIPLEKMTLVGHSLGAHVVGLAGKHVFGELNSKLGKIIGADPAGPFFTYTEENKKLNKDDANCVVALHTDGGLLGYRNSFGALDFFPNEGKRTQPGCRLTLESKDDDLSRDLYSVIDDIYDFAGCSHLRAPTYVIEAFNHIWGADKSFESFGDMKSKFLYALSGDCSSGNNDYYFTTKAESPHLV